MHVAFNCGSGKTRLVGLRVSNARLPIGLSRIGTLPIMATQRPERV